MKKTVLMLLENAFIHENRADREISCLIENGLKVILLCWDRDNKYSEYDTKYNNMLQIYRIKYFAKRGKGVFYLFYKYLIMNYFLIRKGLKQPFDIVHSHNLETIFAGSILSIVKNKPLIYDAHEVLGIYHYRINKMSGKFICQMERFLSSKADSVIVVSPGMRSLFKERNYKNNLISLENFPSLRDFQRVAKDPLKNGTIILGRVGTISKVVNPGMMIRVTRMLKEKDYKIKLIFAGPISTNYDKFFYELIQQNSDIAEYIGIIPAKELYKIYNRIDISLNIPDPVDEFKYGYAAKLFESMAAGVPIIHSDIAETKNVISDANCGILLTDIRIETVFSAVKTLILDNGLRLHLGQNGYCSFLEKYNWESISRKLLEIYSNSLKQN